MTDGPPRGASIGQALSDLAARARVQARAVTLPAETAAKDRFVKAWMERAERELAPTIAVLLGEMADDPDVPDGLRATIKQGMAPTHQVDFIVNVTLMFASVFFQMGAMTEPFVTQLVGNLWETHLHQRISPEAAALAVTRGTWDEQRARAEAKRFGINDNRFDAILGNVGDPLPLGELFVAWRRGIIDTARLQRGIRQSQLRNEWMDVAQALAYSPPGAAEVMRGAVANQITIEHARTLWAQNGLDPAAFDWVYETEGPPPPTEQMIELVRRGEASMADLERALLEGPIKNRWIPTVMKMVRRVPPMEQTIAMIRRGVFTSEEGTRHLTNLGFDADVVAGMVQWAIDSSLEQGRDVAQGQVLTGYRDRFIPRAQAETMLGQLGYAPDGVAFLLDLADYERDRRRMDAQINRTRSRFFARKVTAAEAAVDLDAFGVPAAMRDELIDAWEIELDGTVTKLTRADIINAAKKGILGESETRGRLAAMGYKADDVEVILALAGFVEVV